jgi:hypothetical protein
MPSYTFKDWNTGNLWDGIMSYEDKRCLLIKSPYLRPIIKKAPAIGDAVRLGRIKPAEPFRERLREIKDTHHGSDLNVI